MTTNQGPSLPGLPPSSNETPNPPALEWLITVDAAPAWTCFHDAEVIRARAQEIVAVRDRGTAADWALAGPSIVLQGPDEEKSIELLQRAAAHAGLAFARVPADTLEAGLRLRRGAAFLRTGSDPMRPMLGPCSVASATTPTCRAVRSQRWDSLR